MPAEVIDFLAGQLQVADPSCLKRYSVREPTHREYAGKIHKALALKDFAEVEGELAVFAGRRASVTGDGPKVIFAGAVRWLRERDVLLPGVSRLARLVARERDAATQRLWDSLYAALTGQQRAVLDALLEVPPGSRKPGGLPASRLHRGASGSPGVFVAPGRGPGVRYLTNVLYGHHRTPCLTARQCRDGTAEAGRTRRSSPGGGGLGW